MNTHELLIDVNDGEFIGTIKEVMEYLNLPKTKRLCLNRKANNNQEFSGKVIKVAGVIKHMMVYAVYDQDDVLIETGHSEELANKFCVSNGWIQNAASKGLRIQGMYKIEKVGMEDVIEYEPGYQGKILG